MATLDIQQLLANNRTEELGFDVWSQFVLPPFYQKLSVGDTRKPQVIIGGRGCGKTMLLRYLSHESTFSKDRKEIPTSALSHIGLYWRADTQFANLMQHRSVAADTWAGAFRHLAAVVLGNEVLRSLESIAASTSGCLTADKLVELNFERLRPYSVDVPTRFDDLRRFFEDRLAEFETWVNDVRTVPQPRFLPGQEFLKRMIVLIKDQLTELKTALFFVYIDEYENLTIYQQRIINTWLKHSEPPLVFNLAMKRNGFKTRITDGEEALSDVHDYRDIDIEEFDLNTEFPVFAAEILLLRLKPTFGDDVDFDLLRSLDKLNARKTTSYISRVVSKATTLFPSQTYRELANEVLRDSTLKQRLVDRINTALQNHGERGKNPERFLLPNFPEASIIVPALLHRESHTTDSIEHELEELRKGSPNKFSGETNWIHNNFVGCYLQLFDGLARPCPFFSGFETFCFMARGNLRHFLELCHQAMGRLDKNEKDGNSVSVSNQAEAARQVSANFLAEVRSFGPQGNNLHTFVLRVGSLFSLSQQRPSQSEPERTHFSIRGGDAEISEAESAFLSEAIKWSVLFEERGTKKKSDSDPEGIEYVINPIYSPYFHISYRKRRKVELSSNDAATLIGGSYDEVKELLRKYQRRWSVDLSEASLPLFAHLNK